MHKENGWMYEEREEDRETRERCDEEFVAWHGHCVLGRRRTELRSRLKGTK
jgi:hypothetical protein